MLASIAAILTAVAGILAFVKWVIPAFSKTQQDKHDEIDKSWQEKQQEAEKSGRPQ